MAIELHLHSKLPCSYSIAIHMQVIHIRIDLIFLRLTERVRRGPHLLHGWRQVWRGGSRQAHPRRVLPDQRAVLSGGRPRAAGRAPTPRDTPSLTSLFGIEGTFLIASMDCPSAGGTEQGGSTTCRGRLNKNELSRESGAGALPLYGPLMIFSTVDTCGCGVASAAARAAAAAGAIGASPRQSLKPLRRE